MNVTHQPPRSECSRSRRKPPARGRDDWCASPMQQSCSACSVSLSSISARPSSFSAVRAPSRPPRYVVSLPYTVQVSQMNLVPGATVKAGEEIGQVLSPEQDSIVATYMRALADIAGRTAELRIKARVAQDCLEAARAYLRVTEEAVERIDATSAGTVTFRMEVLRERASARKAVVSQEAEVAESAIQLASLDEFIQQLRGRLDEVERHFGRGPGLCADRRNSLDQVSRMSASRWWRARRSPRSSIRPISSWTGTFPTSA